MEVCSVCGSKSIMPEKYGTVSLCKMCALKILTPTWKNKIYMGNEEVEKQKEKVLKLARNNGFASQVIDGLTAFFDDKKIEGLVKILDGHRGQKLVVCENQCIIETTGYFDYKETEKAYKKMLSGKRGGGSPLDGLDGIINSQMAMGIIGEIVGGALPGGRMIKKQIKRVSRSLAVNAISSQLSGEAEEQAVKRKVVLSVRTGERVIRYSDYDIIKYMEPVGEEEYGFLMLQNSELINDPAEDVLFFFSNGIEIKKEANQMYEYIKGKIEAIQEVLYQESLTKQGYVPIQQSQEMSSADEILKFKQLLDMGAITQEEYEAKKKQLLGL